MTSQSPDTDFHDLPDELIMLISERTDVQSRCVFRKCSKDLRALLDDSEYFCKRIYVRLNSNQEVLIEIVKGSQSLKLSYQSENDGCKVLKKVGIVGENEEGAPDSNVFLPGESHLEVVANDLMTILKNRKLTVEEFSFYNGSVKTNRKLIAVLSRKLATLNHQLQVEKFRMKACFSESDVLDILQFCKPGTLKALELLVILPSKPMMQVVRLEQWKRAKELATLRLEPVTDMLHFNTINFVSSPGWPKYIPWNVMKILLNNIVSKANQSFVKFKGCVETCKEFSKYMSSFKKLEPQEQGEDRFLLKKLGDGSRIELINNKPYLEIIRIVDGQ